MKYTILTLSFLGITTSLFAQKIEVSANAYGNSFKFRGTSTESVTVINDVSPQSNPHGYTNNPFGSKTSYGYGAQGQAQLVFLKSIIVGVQGGYEQTKSNIDINEVNFSQITPGGFITTNQAVTGSSHITYNNIVVNSYIGYRLPVTAFKIDLTFGLETGYILNAREKARATASDGTVYTTDLDRKQLKKDRRLKFGLAAAYHKFGIFGNVAYGHSNYMEDYVGGGPFDVRSAIGRLGVSYQVL